MALIPSKFDEDKALEVILYMASKLTDPTFHQIFKILYFSDKRHLQKYGRLILSDGYVAMKHGPVPSRLYDILKKCRKLPENNTYKNSLQVTNSFHLKSLRNTNLDLLSKSERECLDYAINEFGQLSFKKLTELSHDSAWEKVGENDFISVEDIAATLPNRKDLIENLQGKFC